MKIKHLDLLDQPLDGDLKIHAKNWVRCLEGGMRHVSDVLDTGLYNPSDWYRLHSNGLEGYKRSLWRCVTEQIKMKLEEKVVKLDCRD